MKTSVKRRAKNCIRGTVLLACFIAVWYVASCFTQPLFIPAPATVWEAIVGLAETGQLQKGLAYSFLRITGASALSMLVAIPLSLLIYGVKPIKETIMPVVSFLRYVPVTAFSPLLILWFGIGEQTNCAGTLPLISSWAVSGTERRIFAKRLMVRLSFTQAVPPPKCQWLRKMQRKLSRMLTCSLSPQSITGSRLFRLHGLASPSTLLNPK